MRPDGPGGGPPASRPDPRTEAAGEQGVGPAAPGPAGPGEEAGGSAAPGLAARRRAVRRLARWARLMPQRRRERWMREWQGELDAHFGPAAGWDDDTVREAERRLRGAALDACRVTIEEVGMRMGAMMRGARWGLWRQAVRAWTRRPAFFAVAVATLALGIAATAVLFTVADHVLIRPLGLRDEARLVAMSGRSLEDGPSYRTVSYPNVRDLGERARSLAGAVAISAWVPGIEPGDGAPVVALGGTVSWDYFDVLGVDPALGRGFARSDEGEGRAPVAIVSHDLWQRAFGGDPAVIGRGVPMNGTPYEIVGVLPERYRDHRLFTYAGRPPEIWRTPWQDASAWPRSGRSWRGIARLAPGATLEAAEAEVGAIMAALAEAYPEANRGRTIDLVALRAPVVGPVRTGVLVLLAAVGLLLAVSVLNAAHLVLQRALDRQADWRLRRALGASASRVVGELLAEGLVLAVAAGVAGVAVAAVGVEAVRELAAASLPGADELALDPRVLVAVAALVLGIAVALGLAPAARLVRGRDMGGADLRSGGSTRGIGGLRRGLLVGQVAAAVVLLVGAGLVVRSLERLDAVDLGIVTDGVVVADLHGLGMFDRTRAEAAATYRDMLERLSALEGVTAAGAADIVPLADNFSCDGVTPLDRRPPEPGEGVCAEVRAVTPGLLETLGVPLLAGRMLAWSDGLDAAGAMVFSRMAAERFWPDGDPIGRSALVHGDTFTVVGVVADVRARGPAGEREGHVYLSAAQEPWNGLVRGMGIVVRGQPDAPPSAAAVRAAIQAADPREPVQAVRTLESLRGDRIAEHRLRGALMRAFGALALVLAAVGLAGAVGLSVRRRRREFGVRLALGARGRQLTRQALGEAAGWLAAGTVAGLAIALPAAAAARSLLFGVEPWDAGVLLAAPLVLAGVVLLAAWLPARRAAATDPLTSLRSE